MTLGIDENIKILIAVNGLLGCSIYTLQFSKFLIAPIDKTTDT